VYWYLQKSEGATKRQIYLGPESPDLLERIAKAGEKAAAHRGEMSLVYELDLIHTSHQRVFRSIVGHTRARTSGCRLPMNLGSAVSVLRFVKEPNYDLMAITATLGEMIPELVVEARSTHPLVASALRSNDDVGQLIVGVAAPQTRTRIQAALRDQSAVFRRPRSRRVPVRSGSPPSGQELDRRVQDEDAESA
jgi:hypothetical protein